MSTEHKLRELEDEIVNTHREQLRLAIGKCESPIEALFCLAMLQGDCVRLLLDPIDLPDDVSRCCHLVGAHFSDPFAYRSWTPRGIYLLQHEIGRYRLDLAFVGEGGVLVAIELDGHDYHERTKEQAQRDKSRDRELQKLGWQVFRFTGSEVYRDPLARAYEVEEYLNSLDK